jgi:hypothetical protein
MHGAKHTTAEGGVISTHTPFYSIRALQLLLLLLLLRWAVHFHATTASQSGSRFSNAAAAAASFLLLLLLLLLPPPPLLLLLLLQMRMPSGMQGAKHTTAEGGIRSFLAVQGPGVSAGDKWS